jgi:hypothetical protein
MRMFLYHFGYIWHPIQIVEVMEKLLAETEFVNPDSAETIGLFDYVVRKAGKNAPPWIRDLDSKSKSVRFRNPGRDVRLFAPLGLLKFIHRTDHPEAKELHQRSIKGPEERFGFGKSVIERYFRNETFLGERLSINPNSHVIRPAIFPVPCLEFGQGKLFRVALSEKQTPQVVEKAEKPKVRMEGVESSVVLRIQTLFPTELRARKQCI